MLRVVELGRRARDDERDRRGVLRVDHPGVLGVQHREVLLLHAQVVEAELIVMTDVREEERAFVEAVDDLLVHLPWRPEVAARGAGERDLHVVGRCDGLGEDTAEEVLDHVVDERAEAPLVRDEAQEIARLVGGRRRLVRDEAIHIRLHLGSLAER